MDQIDQTRQQGQARRLAQALLAPADEPACSACLDALEAYIADQAAGLDYAGRSPAVAQHLDSCLRCAESYALLADLLAAPVLPEPAVIPAPDLSFLHEGAADRLTPAALRTARRSGRLRAALDAAVERAGGRLRLTLSQALLELLPAPGPQPAFRSSEPGAPLFELAVEQPGAEVESLQLTAYAAAGVPDRCAVRVQLALRDREWPDLAGVPVALALGGGRRQSATDTWGEVAFDDVPVAELPQLQVEVGAGA